MKILKSNPYLFLANMYILLSILYYWLETLSGFNPIAYSLFIVFGLHLFAAKGKLKFIFPSIFLLINLYMFLALFSEFREFKTLNKDAMLLLGVGILYLGLNVLSAVTILKNVNHDQLEIKNA